MQDDSPEYIKFYDQYSRLISEMYYDRDINERRIKLLKSTLKGLQKQINYAMSELQRLEDKHSAR